MSGKGDEQRPSAVSREEFESNWDAAFRRRPNSKTPPETAPELTPGFLAVLVRAARAYGWAGDYIEICDFVNWCHEQAGLEPPSEKDMVTFDELHEND